MRSAPWGCTSPLPTGAELAGIIEAKDLDLDSLEVDPAEMDLCYASAAGRGFAQSGGVAKAVAEKGWLGVFTGGLTATAGGIAAAVVFGVLMALLFKPGDKR